MNGLRDSLMARVACILLCCQIVVSSDRPPANDEITLEREQIIINFENITTFSLMMEPDDSVQDLKEDLREYEGLPWNIRLQLGDTRLSYDSKLSDYNIRGAAVSLFLNENRISHTVSFTVMTRDGRELPVTTRLDQTVASLKNNVTHWTGIPQAEQRLLLNGKELKDDRKLALYGIYDQITINLGEPIEDCRGRPVTILVKTLSGATIEVEVDLADTVSELKERICHKAGIPVAAQRLFLNDRAITGEDHLCDLQLGSGFILYMFLYSSRITSLDQVARLPEEVPRTRVEPNKGPIFREAEGLLHNRRSFFKDARNWLARSVPRPGYTLSMFNPVAYWAPDPDDETQTQVCRQTIERLSSADASEPERLKASVARAQLKLSSAVRPYRVAANLSSAERQRQHSGITLGGGSTYMNPNRQVPLGADINNWAPDAFSDADVMRLFEVSERVRQALASGEGILCMASQRRINRAILMTYLEALADFQPAVRCNQPGEGEECSICIDQLSAEPALRLPCEHTFHADCILSWLTDLYRDGAVPSCPLCRQRFMFPYEAQGKAELETPEFEQDHQGKRELHRP